MKENNLKGQIMKSSSWLNDYFMYGEELISLLPFIEYGAYDPKRIISIVFDKVKESVKEAFFAEPRKFVNKLSEKKGRTIDEMNELIKTLMMYWTENPVTSEFVKFSFENPSKIIIGGLEYNINRLQYLIVEEWASYLTEPIIYDNIIYPMLYIFNICLDYKNKMAIKKKDLWLKTPIGEVVGRYHIKYNDIALLCQPFRKKNSFPHTLQCNFFMDKIWYYDLDGNYHFLEKNSDVSTYNRDADRIFRMDKCDDYIINDLLVQVPGKWMLTCRGTLKIYIYKTVSSSNEETEFIDYIIELARSKEDRIYIRALQLCESEDSIRKRRIKDEYISEPLF